MRTILLVCASACAALWAQNQDSASIAGITQDFEGRPLAHVTVTLRPLTTSPGSAPINVTQSTQSDDQGTFRFDRVSPGLYRLSGEHRANLVSKRPTTATLDLTAAPNHSLSGLILKLEPPQK